MKLYGPAKFSTSKYHPGNHPEDKLGRWNERSECVEAVPEVTVEDGRVILTVEAASRGKKYRIELSSEDAGAIVSAYADIVARSEGRRV